MPRVTICHSAKLKSARINPHLSRFYSRLLCGFLYLLGDLQWRLADGVRAHGRSGHQNRPFEQTCANKIEGRRLITLLIQCDPTILEFLLRERQKYTQNYQKKYLK